MKNILAICLITVFVVLLGTASFSREEPLAKLKAEVKFYETKLEKIDAHLERLKMSLAEAVEEKDRRREALINLMIAKEYKRKKAVSEDIAKRRVELARWGYYVEKVMVNPARLSSLVVEVGMKAGTGLLEAAYVLPFTLHPRVELRAGWGHGVGKDYTLFVLQGEWVYSASPQTFFGISGDFANYSENAREIVGLPAVIEKGTHTGVGIFIGHYVGDWFSKIAYSPALGVSLTVGSRI